MGWMVRLLEELKVADSAHFMTYTYDEMKVPYTKLAYKTLDPRHLTLYYKTLRNLHIKHHKRSNIKYFACGEYGSETHRPHYHDIIFNADIDLIEKSWQHGQVFRGEVNHNSIGYVTGYILKPQKPIDPESDEIRMFRRMSKGLGRAYIRASMKNWHNQDLTNRYYYPNDDSKLSLPRYLKQALFDEDQRKIITAHYQELEKNSEQLSTGLRKEILRSDEKLLTRRRDFKT